MPAGVSYFCTYWGSDTLAFADFLSKVKAAGFDGVEMSLPMEGDERKAVCAAIAAHGLALIGQHWETFNADFGHHRMAYLERLRNLAAARPLFINSHTGKDWFTVAQNTELISLADEVAMETGVRIVHETHRGRFAFSAGVTQDYLAASWGLELCLDISHWCCVSESLLEDQESAVDAALRRTRHIHARVGWEQGPQISDPRAPEWAGTVERHVDWWRQVVAHNAAAGHGTTITTEFGPAPYMARLPFGGAPVCDQWEANVHMLGLLRQRLA